MVRELTHYRCASDPFKGDMPWKRVQQYAREAMDALHSAPPAADGRAGAGVAHLDGKIQGFGSDSNFKSSSSSSYVGYGGSNSNKRMTGFGGPLEANNNNYQQQSMLEAFTTGIKGITDRVTEAVMRPQHQRLASYDSEESRGLYQHDSRSFLPPSFPESGLARDSQEQLPPPKHHLSSSQREDPFGPSSTKSKEEELVDSSCNVSSLRVVPSTSDVKRFIKETHSNCDGTLLAQALQGKLVRGGRSFFFLGGVLS